MPPATLGTAAAGSVGTGLRLAPHAVLLHRSPHELQVGVDPSVVVPAAYGTVLRTLATGTTRPVLDEAAAATGLPVHSVGELLDALRAAHLLRPEPPASHAGVRVVGCGQLAARTAHELAVAGFERVYLAELPGRSGRPAHRTRTEPSPRRSVPRTAERAERVELLSSSLKAAHPALRVRRSRHVTEPEGSAVALTVVVADGPEPDRLVTDVLHDHGAPHLLVRGGGSEAVVGPLVVPGATSCVRCADLARRDADPRWPWLLDQLTRTELEPSPTLLTWAAVTAALQALAFVSGARAETLGHTLELGPELALRLRPWSVHPDCRCRGDAVAGPDAGTDVLRG